MQQTAAGTADSGDFDRVEIEGRIVQRKKYYVVYIKEGAGISDFLNVVEAHVALMEFENSRIVREVRNTVNRRVNCENCQYYQDGDSGGEAG